MNAIRVLAQLTDDKHNNNWSKQIQDGNIRRRRRQRWRGFIVAVKSLSCGARKSQLGAVIVMSLKLTQSFMGLPNQRVYPKKNNALVEPVSIYLGHLIVNVQNRLGSAQTKMLGSLTTSYRSFECACTYFKAN